MINQLVSFKEVDRYIAFATIGTQETHAIEISVTGEGASSAAIASFEGALRADAERWRIVVKINPYQRFQPKQSKIHNTTCDPIACI